MNVYTVVLDSIDTFKKFKYKNDNLKISDRVIVSYQGGLETGKIISISKDNIKNIKNYDSIIRKVNINDINKIRKNNISAQKAFIKFRDLIKKNKLNMKPINAYYIFDRSQLIFKFMSDIRVDFRNLAKELANIYKTRIELRQIGIRDKARVIGGCGQCGRELCCKNFINDFVSVSINMAKNQDISLNPNKINGSCGRLLCCLNYEDECYKECRKNLPTVGKIVKISEGTGKVTRVDVLKEKYYVNIEDKGIIECGINDSVK